MRRRAAVAGTFYPADPVELARTVDGLLAAAGRVEPVESPRAIVVPHAGYAYSGPVAASAYSRLARRSGARVALIGPAHFIPLLGVAAPAADMWETPLGAVRIDDGLRAAALDAGVVLDDRPHGPEHALEVQLPFLIRALGSDVTILPLAVGSTRAVDAADVIEAVCTSTDLLVVSTDLSHYLDRSSAERIDRGTTEAIVARDTGALPDGAACGVRALRGIVEFARRRDLPVRPLDLRTSADAGGDTRNVVGYGSFAIG